MAEAAVFAMVKQLVFSMIEPLVPVKHAVDQLKSNLTAIKAKLADAETRQVKEATFRDWQEKLRDVAYDIEDVLDDWDAAILSSQKNPGDEQDVKKLQRKVSSFIRSFCIHYQQHFRGDIARKIKELNERLDRIAQQRDRYHFDERENNPPIERTMTTYLIDIRKVEGREKDKSDLVKMLLSEPSVRDGSDPRVISIVGMGGIGKTTLAQYAFNHDRIKAHFGDNKFWVCVSDPFDETRVAKRILTGLLGSTPNFTKLEHLHQKIGESIKHKRFLLVLDDVWEDDPTKWGRLKQYLTSGSPESKILVVTRKENAALSMGCSKDNILRIGKLSNEECWLILNKIACFGRSDIDRKNLELIGKKISKKCGGLPLAAKTLGWILKFIETREGWESILSFEIWELEEVQRDVIAPLWLSYYDLSPDLKRFFSYCAVFPKGYEIRRSELIQLWMAQGYLKKEQSKDLEIIGETHFQNLAMHSFLQNFEKDEDNDRRIYSCKMHNIVHDFAQLVARNECCHAQLDYPLESIRKVRHMGLTLSNWTTSSLRFEDLKKMRSLLFLQSGRRLFLTTASLSRLFREVTRVRSLSLRCFVFVEIPSSIRKLVQLRWLDLSSNGELKLLPETLCELYHLQTIDVSGCCGVELPSGIGKLIDLRHLRNSGGPSRLPKGIARLTGLRTLEEVDVGCGGEAFSLGDLKNLNQLRGRLEIRNLGAYKRHVGEAKQAELKKKEHVTNLVLRFSYMEKEEEEEEEGEGEPSTPRNEEEEEGEGEPCTPRNEEKEEEEGERFTPRNEELLEALEPSPNLEILGISDYGGTTFPDWMISLANLRHVGLSDFYNSDHLPSLGKLPSLETLTLAGMTRVEKVGLVLLGIETRIGDSKSEISAASSSSSSSPVVVSFPSLKKLQFSLMRGWEEWDDYYDGTTKLPATIMPSLRFLRIFDCPLLKALPGYILHNTMLETLQIGGSDLLRDRYNEENGEDWSKISHMPHVKIYH